MMARPTPWQRADAACPVSSSSLHCLVVRVFVPLFNRHAERVDVAVAQLDLCGKFDARCMGGERW